MTRHNSTKAITMTRHNNTKAIKMTRHNSTKAITDIQTKKKYKNSIALERSARATAGLESLGWGRGGGGVKVVRP